MGIKARWVGLNMLGVAVAGCSSPASPRAGDTFARTTVLRVYVSSAAGEVCLFADSRYELGTSALEASGKWRRESDTCVELYSVQTRMRSEREMMGAINEVCAVDPQACGQPGFLRSDANRLCLKGTGAYLQFPDGTVEALQLADSTKSPCYQRLVQ